MRGSSSGPTIAINLFSASTGATANPRTTTVPAAFDTRGADDRADVTAATYVTALAVFTGSLGAGSVSIPGFDASLVGAGLEAHAAANNRVALLCPVQGTPNASVAALAATFRGTTGSEYCGYFWPWTQVPNGAGGSYTISPDAFVAGVRSRTVAAAGPWQAPAGGFGVARYVTGLDPASGTVTDAIGDALNDEHVNVIRPRAGIRLYGWRSLSTDTVNYELLSARDILNEIDVASTVGLEQYAFAVIDSLGQLFKKMANTELAILQPYIAAGALYPGPAASNGTPSDPGYLVDTGPDVNTPTTLGNNEACVAVYVRPSPTAEMILATITKVAVNNAF